MTAISREIKNMQGKKVLLFFSLVPSMDETLRREARDMKYLEDKDVMLHSWIVFYLYLKVCSG